MAEFFDKIEDKHQRFIEEQPMFFIATACADGRVNLSPKGMDTFKVLSPNRFVYLDLTGSGNETAAHIKKDGRVTVMFNSYTRNPLILRLYGQGHVIRPGHLEFDELSSNFIERSGTRQFISVDVESVQTSCGYAVPLMEISGERDTLEKWATTKGKDGLKEYKKIKNSQSIDGFDTGLNDE
ncbi:pyridoxamine 5'-phosphate oxidase family protein [Temperatibacter marinus]|uniref:Pyridoxamine 5'-phosphate oxidase family protein n=1 Tax=Temperatibacter marinus TaxID=1456591 RepID=A0AA52EIX9_9PROT|nr:pyridoxamine 5'-phosphate oxidase family protein [Temperatibacter marinus]WND03134.1 pyridoxamine 5'-phosphate oxidase family protein [Temperatibacter marinus]